jgi:hypothetical protein
VSRLRPEALALQVVLGGRAVVCGATGGWPPALAFRLDGDDPDYEWPCPYGNFAWVRLSEDAMARLGPDWDYRDLLTLAALEPALCT